MTRPPTTTHDDSPLRAPSLALLDAIRARPRGTYEEWRRDLRWGSTSTVKYNLHHLERAGLVTWTPGAARSVVLLDGAVGCERCARLETALRQLARDVTAANAYPECVERVQAVVEQVLGEK